MDGLIFSIYAATNLCDFLVDAFYDDFTIGYFFAYEGEFQSTGFLLRKNLLELLVDKLNLLLKLLFLLSLA